MYIVMELQTTGKTTATLTNAYTDKNTAYQKYHTILAAAAVSTVEIHTAVIMNEYGVMEARETYTHGGEEV